MPNRPLRGLARIGGPRSGTSWATTFAVVTDVSSPLDPHQKVTAMNEAWIIDAVPHAPRHRQGRQGRARRHPPAAARRHGAGRARATATTSTPPTSTTSSGAPARRSASRAATSAAWRRSTPATTSRRQRRHARPLLRLGHHHRQPGRGLDHVGHGGRRDRRRHRDDVAHPALGAAQTACAAR